MAESIIQYFEQLGWGKELVVFIIAYLPVVELRGAIPVAIGYYHMTALQAFFIATLSNVLITPPLYFFLKYITGILRRYSKLADRFFNWLFARALNKHSKKLQVYGATALITFVAIPLPGTGAYTGTLIAYLLNIPFKNSFLYISLGVILAGIAVTLLSMGFFGSLGFLLG